MDDISRRILGKVPTLMLLRAGDLARPLYQRTLKPSLIVHRGLFRPQSALSTIPTGGPWSVGVPEMWISRPLDTLLT